ncbi:phosphoglucomutase/phosphomannomutase alpha/beta/alpha domain I [Methanohalobium evestigatum Z-7303]|uniref:Phosphoglucomutase/phosphomannomutase alpha/beta/alpha domain I n=1 Tax=Methanohalobium evestigatum (strain ATCC BAA-1072 / DSM 3721 / NBRC 107634 / OCM 161 / Z-7303) TaxID=644295 RepID=D7E637_METEZ|nr:phosphoglucosamine mutase [Methanohalobium evestigatum]ADI73059.1 phosphoglucomutase/phosphomannomutase alpha/beta/alpha domain I [Methanohalobium evestigatum Z-7303]
MGLFGTNGVRGIANEEITPELAVDIAKSLGTYLGNNATVAIGRDTRVSGNMIKYAAISGSLSSGLSVIDVDMVPTPSIQYYIKNTRTDAGIIITASHNPREYNGIKLIDGDGTEFSREGEKEVENIYYSKQYNNAGWENTGNLQTDHNVNDYYIKGIINSVDAEKIQKQNFKVVVDTGCGAGSLTLPFLLRKLGCEVITINAQIDGTFPWRNPEPTPDVLEELSEIIRLSGADMGVAQDGDADRAVFTDENGNFVDEEVLLSLVAKNILNQKKGPIVTPVSSSQRMADVAKEAGVELIWTAVGSINVARKMMEMNAVFGGEGNGGLIFPEHQYCRDGAMSCAKLLEIMASGTPLSKLAEDVPEYYNSKTKIPCNNLEHTMECIKKKVHEDNVGIKIDTIDGVKVWFEDGWVLVRPSGTEPIIRVYAESKTMSRAEKLMENGALWIKNCE